MDVLSAFHIKPIQLKDAWPICDFAVANEDRLKRFFPKTLEQNLTPQLSQRFVDKMVKQFHLKEVFLYTLKEKTSSAIAGLVYIKTLDWEKLQGEFAYCIGYQFEGKGLISESVKLLSEYAFDELHLKTLQIIAYKDNTASVKVAEKCGYNWIKTLPKAFAPTPDNPLDMELYELYNER